MSVGRDLRSSSRQPADATGRKPRYEDRILGVAADAGTAAVVPIDASGSGQPELLVWSHNGVALYRHGTLAADSGLAGISGVTFVAPGDFDNDALTDLCILTEAGPLLYRNVKGRFARVDANLPKRRYELAVWMDYDRDYDLDLLLGESSALMQNQGAAGFSDRTGGPSGGRHAKSREPVLETKGDLPDLSSRTQEGTQ